MKSKSKFNQQRSGPGTKEWADENKNVCRGCEHWCLYCYAWRMACWRDESMRGLGAWKEQGLKPTWASQGPLIKNKGVVMFPSSHDITPKFLPECLETIRGLLKKGNQVLIVSKPHLPVVQTLCRELSTYKSDILFRFTITSLSKATCAFWEPGAPPPQERIAALKHAFNNGFATSVSIEPMLEDREHIVRLVATVDSFVTDTIWVGKMRNIPHRLKPHITGLAEAVKKIGAQQTDSEILQLVKALQGHPYLRWKDSIQAVLARNPADTGIQ